MKIFDKVTIIGVGLIGGSIGLAIKKHRLAKVVCGVGRRISSLKNAKRLGAADVVTLDLSTGVKGADLIIIATAISFIPQYALRIAALSGIAKKGLIITDTGSTKEFVVSKLERILPPGLHFVGSHPFAGSEKSGVLHASADLFKAANVFVTPTKDTDKIALSKIKNFWKATGAAVLVMSAGKHDQLVAGISHMPHIMAAVLVNSVCAKDAGFASTGFRDTTRIASSDPLMWRDICLSNRKHILDTIAKFKKNLEVIENVIKKGDVKSLMQQLEAARKKRKLIS